MFDPHMLAQMELPDDITIGEAISSTYNSEAWGRFRFGYPTAVLRFYYRQSREPVDPGTAMGDARKLIKEKVIVVSIDGGSDGLLEDA